MSYVISPDHPAAKRSQPHGEYTHFVVRDVPMMTHVCLNPGQSTDTHKHMKEVQTYYVLEGSGFMIVDGEKFPIKAGEVAVIPPGKDHSMENPNATPLRWLMQYLLEGSAEYPIYKK
jgi:mannose-6-phosphate isomerase-like protein (cupin superfamily)